MGCGLFAQNFFRFIFLLLLKLLTTHDRLPVSDGVGGALNFSHGQG
jgi:hypothetical protein